MAAIGAAPGIVVTWLAESCCGVAVGPGVGRAGVAAGPTVAVAVTSPAGTFVTTSTAAPPGGTATGRSGAATYPAGAVTCCST